MKGKLSILPIVFTIIALLIFTGCAEKVCPANGREYHHRQLKKINAKRKRDFGLFPKSMEPSKRKKKKKSSNNNSEEIVE
ncbi:MAG: hypothetical protein JXQ87_02335 [Bacteroidia bacterium]